MANNLQNNLGGVNGELAVVADPHITEDALDIIERRNLVFEKLMYAAIKATSATDWIDQNGKPYLQASGAEKVARRFGVRIFDTVIDREEIEDENGRYYIYTVTGKAALSARDEIEVIGTCSSRDKFFGRSGGTNKATADVDMGNIKKKAYTNFLGNAITRLLGIRNLTWDDLAKYGVTKNGKTSVAYDKGTSTAAASKSAANAESKSKMPYWTWKNDKGALLIFANAGKHFSPDFLSNLGMKESSKKPGCYGCDHSEQIENALKDEFVAAEEQLAIQQEGSAA